MLKHRGVNQPHLFPKCNGSGVLLQPRHTPRSAELEPRDLCVESWFPRNQACLSFPLDSSFPVTHRSDFIENPLSFTCVRLCPPGNVPDFSGPHPISKKWQTLPGGLSPPQGPVYWPLTGYPLPCVLSTPLRPWVALSTLSLSLNVPFRTPSFSENKHI